MSDPSDATSWKDFDPADSDFLNRPGLVTLEQNGWQALVAFAAGPVVVRSVPVPGGRTVRVWRQQVTSGGAAREVTEDEPMSARDEEIIYGDMVEYLADAGIPAPPQGVQWTLVLPPHMTEEQFWAALDQATQPAIDAMIERMATGSAGTTPRLELLNAVRSALARLYAQS